MTSFVAVAAVEVAVNVSGELVSVPAVAVTVCAPTPAPSVQFVDARPLASEMAVSGETDPPPLARTAKVTVVPATATPSLAATLTSNGRPSSAPAVPGLRVAARLRDLRRGGASRSPARCPSDP